MKPRMTRVGTLLVLAGAVALTACGHSKKTPLDARDAEPVSSDTAPKRDLPADGDSVGRDAAADAGGAADTIETADAADTADDVRVPRADGADADTAIVKPDAGPDGRDAGKDAVPDGVAREVAVDGGGSAGCTTLLLGGTLPLDQTWGSPVALVELDGDGMLDLVTTTNVLFGQGDGRFSGKLDDVRGNAVADLNGDGNLDIVAANTGLATVSVFLGRGDRTFAGKMDYAAGLPRELISLSGRATYEPTAVALGDVNGDGNPDIATVNYDSSSVSVLLGKGNGTFAPKQDYPTDVGPTSLALGDVNSDGKTDLVVANYNQATLSVLLGTGDGTFAATEAQPIPIDPDWVYGGKAPTPIALHDLDGDGTLDLLLVDYDANLASVLLGKGDGTFGGNLDHPTGIHPTAFVLADVSGDGKADLVTANAPGSLSVLLGKGDGGFAPQREYPIFAASMDSLAVGDVNGDGKVDIAGRAGVVLFGKGDGSFVTGAQPWTGSAPAAALLRDLDGDGHLDLVAVTSSADAATVRLGAGDGTFAAGVDYPTGDGPQSIAVGDVNGDGKLDLATVNIAAGTVSVLPGKGDGTFAAKQDYATAPEATALALGDLNADGKLDVVTAASNGYGSGGTVSVLLGTGGGKLAAAVDHTAGNNTQAVALADLNADGKLDLVVANTGADGGWSLSVWPGKGDGTFGTRIDDASIYGPSALALGDLNGDGKPDVVAGHSITGNGVSVQLGNGDGTLAAKVDYKSAGPTPVLGDVDGDGALDIVSGGTGAVSVSFGTGDGTFAATTDYLAGRGPVAVGDVNGDGRMDIVQPGAGNAISVFLASCL